VSGSPAGRVAVVFFAYQLVGAAFCTVAFDPLLRLLERWAPRSPLQQLSKAKFLFDDAVVDPSLAIDLAMKEEGRLTEWLPMMLDEVRSEPVLGASKPDVLCAASHSVARLMTSYLEGILESNLGSAERERVIRLQHRTANLEALFDSLDEFRHAARDAQQWAASGRVAQNMIEALHALLSALVDALNSDDATDRDLLLRLLGARDEMMERVRQRVLRENPDLPAKAQEALFSATMLFERIVWLARRTTLLLSPPDVAAAEQEAA
jgi:phosphate:Na+ symporter